LYSYCLMYYIVVVMSKDNDNDNDDSTVLYSVFVNK